MKTVHTRLYGCAWARAWFDVYTSEIMTALDWQQHMISARRTDELVKRINDKFIQ
jgi:hypothetical protein